MKQRSRTFGIRWVRCLQFRAIQEERDAAYAEIQTLHGVSHLVLDEVGNMQNQLEIEKTCRESAENYASQMNKENKKLKRISMKFMAKIGIMEFPDNLLDIDDPPLPAEYAEIQDLNSDSVEKLQKQVSDLLEENTRLGEQLKECQSKIEALVEQLQNEQAERDCLVEKLAEKDATLKKYNRVSTLALDEFTELRENLKLEQELRQKAEDYAHKMLVEKKQAQRQTQVLSNNASSNAVLAQALEDVSTMAARLEKEHSLREKFEHDLQVQIDGSMLRHELDLLRPRLQVAEEQRCEAAEQAAQAKVEARNLEHKLGMLQNRVEELEKSQLLSTPHPPPPPPPPPPLPPPPLAPHNPLKSLMAMLKGRPAGQKGSPSSNASGPSPKDELESVRQTAVDEMMQRIRNGVQLRSVSRPQASKSMEKLDGESAVDTLRNLLHSPGSQQRPVQAEPASECELSLILRRRREATESLSGQEKEGDSRPALGPKSCSLPTLLD
uniref:shootin-1-like isoform X2 n=1 Tax=Myxine glutinosa TaxID=7769 RepID=UPI00358EDD80